MLTRQQKRLLDFLREKTKEEVPPSYDEMREQLGLKSKSGIHRLVLGLEERGYIRRLVNRARAIEVIDPSERSRYSFRQTPALDAENIRLPLLGKIAAGTPIEALSDPTSNVDVPAHMLGTGEHFALEIVGDSMIEAGILEGDTVVIQRADSAEHGEIVVALVKQQEATLKTLVKEPGRIGLKAANPRYETRYFHNDEVQVQGRLSGLIRRY